MLALSGMLYQKLKILSAEPAEYAVIQVNGEVYEKLDLSQDTELMYEDEWGNYNLIKVENGYVTVTEANCSDLTCMYMGAICSETGGVIACLPHRLIIYIE